MGALKSLLLKSGSMGGVDSTVVYMYVHTNGMALLGIPPPSSDILIVMSCAEFSNKIGKSHPDEMLYYGTG